MRQFLLKIHTIVLFFDVWIVFSAIAIVMLNLSAYAESPNNNLKKPFLGPDYSGVYACKGIDSHEGPYTATVHMVLVREQSSGQNAAYDFKMDVPGYGRYAGEAASQPGILAFTFSSADPATKDYGTGIAKITLNEKRQWRFTKYYYEPAFKGGNFGHETCMHTQSKPR